MTTVSMQAMMTAPTTVATTARTMRMASRRIGALARDNETIFLNLQVSLELQTMTMTMMAQRTRMHAPHIVVPVMAMMTRP